MSQWPAVRARLVDVGRRAGLSDDDVQEMLGLVSRYGLGRFASGVDVAVTSCYDLLMNDAEHTQGGVTGTAHSGGGYRTRWSGSPRGRALFERAVAAEIEAAQYEPGTPEHRKANEDLSTATTEWRNHKD